MSTPLYEVGMEALAIQDALFDSLGEITPEIEASMDALLAKGSQSLVSAAWVVSKLEADAELCKAEAKRLSDRAASIENGVESLKGRMVFAVDAAFNGKLKTPTHTIWAQNAAPAVTVELAEGTDLAALDKTHSELVRKSYYLDKTAIRNRWEAGDPLPISITVTKQEPKRYLMRQPPLRQP